MTRLGRNFAILFALFGPPALPSREPPSNAVASATALMRSGSFNEAHQLLSDALAGDGSDPRLWTLDGYALSHMQRDREALTSYESALRLAPRYLPALEGAAELKFKTRSPDAAQLLQQLASLQPTDQTTHAMLATLAFEHRDCETAEAEFQKSERLLVTQALQLEQRGACLIRLNRPRTAVTAFQQLARLDSARPHVHYNLALSQFEAGLYREAISTLTALPASKRDSDALDLLSSAYESISDTPSAVAALREAIVLNPGSTQLYLHFADLCLAHASFQAGVDMLNAGIHHSPKASSLYLARGILQIQLAQYAAAEEDFSRAETLDPNTRYAAALQGMTRLQQNHLGQAAGELRKRIKQQPKDAFLHYLLAETLLRSGAAQGSPEFSQALEAAKTAVRLQPELGLARDVLGRLYLQSGNINGAVEQSKLAFADDPTDQTALYHLILALRKAGRTSEIPALVKKLTALRQQAQQKEIDERRFAIVTKPSLN